MDYFAFIIKILTLQQSPCTNILNRKKQKINIKMLRKIIYASILIIMKVS